jgi:hypothetical protein
MMDQPLGHGRFAQQRHFFHHAGRTEQHHPIGINGKTGPLGHHVIDGDKVQPFTQQLGTAVFKRVMGLGSKAQRDTRG